MKEANKRRLCWPWSLHFSSKKPVAGLAEVFCGLVLKVALYGFPRHRKLGLRVWRGVAYLVDASSANPTEQTWTQTGRQETEQRTQTK